MPSLYDVCTVKLQMYAKGLALVNGEEEALQKTFLCFLLSYIPIIPTQCFYLFFGNFNWSVAKLNQFYTSIKTHAYEYLLSLISALISHC